MVTLSAEFQVDFAEGLSNICVGEAAYCAVGAQTLKVSVF